MKISLFYLQIFVQIATIVYSILGIPLFMVCMVNIGDTMANTFR
jgi:hypothetical protein